MLEHDTEKSELEDDNAVNLTAPTQAQSTEGAEAATTSQAPFPGFPGQAPVPSPSFHSSPNTTSELVLSCDFSCVNQMIGRKKFRAGLTSRLLSFCKSLSDENCHPSSISSLGLPWCVWDTTSNIRCQFRASDKGEILQVRAPTYIRASRSEFLLSFSRCLLSQYKCLSNC
jgi:hypothetical protein